AGGFRRQGGRPSAGAVRGAQVYDAHAETSGDVSEGAGGGDGGAASVGGGLERGADDVRAGERPSGERRGAGEGGGDRRGAGKLRGRDERRGRGGSVAAGTRPPEGGQCGRAAEKLVPACHGAILARNLA